MAYALVDLELGGPLDNVTKVFLSDGIVRSFPSHYDITSVHVVDGSMKDICNKGKEYLQTINQCIIPKIVVYGGTHTFGLDSIADVSVAYIKRNEQGMMNEMIHKSFMEPLFDLNDIVKERNGILVVSSVMSIPAYFSGEKYQSEFMAKLILCCNKEIAKFNKLSTVNTSPLKLFEDFQFRNRKMSCGHFKVINGLFEKDQIHPNKDGRAKIVKRCLKVLKDM